MDISGKDGRPKSNSYILRPLCIVCCHFHIFISKYLSRREIQCLCRQKHNRRCAGMLDYHLETGFSQIPRRRLHSTPLSPLVFLLSTLPHTGQRLDLTRGHTVSNGFYHLSVQLSRIKAFNTWVFGTHSKSLSCYLDSFSILQNWRLFFFLFFPMGDPVRGCQKTGSSFWLLFPLRPWMPPSLTIPPCFANHLGNCSLLAQVQLLFSSFCPSKGPHEANGKQAGCGGAHR